MVSGVCVRRAVCQQPLFRIPDFRRMGLLQLQQQQHQAQTLVGVQQRQHLHHLQCHQQRQQQQHVHRRQFDASVFTWSRRGRRYYVNVAGTTEPLQQPETVPPNSDVTVRYVRGLPHVVVPLPSRSEKCQFTLRPVSHSVGDFLDMLRAEDKGIDRATIVNADGHRIAAACSIEHLMDEEFWLHVNDKRYHVQPPKRAQLSIEDNAQIGDVRALVSQLYEALHVEEHQVKKEKELATRLEQLTEELLPYEKIQNDLARSSERKTEIMTWVGLGMMGVQFGILARLTWWEYSWDIMEPVTYFVTYGTAMAAYAYYCLTKQEYYMPDVKDRQYLISMYKQARKHKFDVDKYNTLKREQADVQTDLRRLRDPLYHRYSSSAALSSTVRSAAAGNCASGNDAASGAAQLLGSKGRVAGIINTAMRKLKK